MTPGCSARCRVPPTRRYGSRCFPTGSCRARFPSSSRRPLHIATEGPLGFAARRYCVSRGLELHHLVSHAVSAVPAFAISDSDVGFRIGRCAGFTVRPRIAWSARRPCAISSPSAAFATWSAGSAASTRSCSGRGAKNFLQLPRPIAAYVGRVAIEKNIDAFLRMPWTGTKLVIGDGPELPRLKAQYPNAVYAGFRFGEDLAQHLAAVGRDGVPEPHRHLRSREPRSHGLRSARGRLSRSAGPIDVVEDGVTGALDAGSGARGRACARASIPQHAAIARCARAGRCVRASSKRIWFRATVSARRASCRSRPTCVSRFDGSCADDPGTGCAIARGGDSPLREQFPA